MLEYMKKIQTCNGANEIIGISDDRIGFDITFFQDAPRGQKLNGRRFFEKVSENFSQLSAKKNKIYNYWRGYPRLLAQSTSECFTNTAIHDVRYKHRCKSLKYSQYNNYTKWQRMNDKGDITYCLSVHCKLSCETMYTKELVKQKENNTFGSDLLDTYVT